MIIENSSIVKKRKLECLPGNAKVSLNKCHFAEKFREIKSRSNLSFKSKSIVCRVKMVSLMNLTLTGTAFFTLVKQRQFFSFNRRS